MSISVPRFAVFLVTLALIVLTGSDLGALEITTELYMGNLAFEDDRTETETDLPNTYPWGVSVYGTQQVSPELDINLSFIMDPTLRYISYTTLEYVQPFFSISVGPFFGLFNSRNTILKPGISTSVRAEFPGVAFVEFRADSSIGGRLVQTGDYIQERSDVSLGFYVRNAICSVNLLTKGYTYRTATDEIVDNYLEYSFETDIFQKSVPYRILLSFAYQERSKTFINIDDSTDTTIHRLSSIVLGTKVEVNLADWMLLQLNLDSSVFSFGSIGEGLLELPTTGIEQYRFNATVGVKVLVDRLTGGAVVR